MIIAVYLGRHHGQGGGIGVYVRGLLLSYIEHASELLPPNTSLLIIGDSSVINPQTFPQSERIKFFLLPNFYSHKLGMIYDQLFLPFLLYFKNAALLHSLANIGIVCSIPGSRIKQIITMHDLFQAFPVDVKVSLVQFVYRFLFWVQFRRASKIICDTEVVANEISQRYSFPKENIFTVPLGVDQEFARICVNQNVYSEPLYSEPAKKSYVLVLGSQDPRKNTRRILDAWRALPETLKSQGLVVKHLGERCAAVLEMPFCDAKYVRELDWLTREELAKLMREASVVVVPTLAEGFGFPAIEAALLGTPVVTSELEAFKYFDLQKDLLYFCNPKNVDEVSSAIVKAFEHEREPNKNKYSKLRTLDDTACETLLLYSSFHKLCDITMSHNL